MESFNKKKNLQSEKKFEKNLDFLNYGNSDFQKCWQLTILLG